MKYIILLCLIALSIQQNFNRVGGCIGTNSTDKKVCRAATDFDDPDDFVVQMMTGSEIYKREDYVCCYSRITYYYPDSTSETVNHCAPYVASHVLGDFNHFKGLLREGKYWRGVTAKIEKIHCSSSFFNIGLLSLLTIISLLF